MTIKKVNSAQRPESRRNVNLIIRIARFFTSLYRHYNPLEEEPRTEVRFHESFELPVHPEEFERPLATSTPCQSPAQIHADGKQSFILSTKNSGKMQTENQTIQPFNFTRSIAHVKVKSQSPRAKCKKIPAGISKSATKRKVFKQNAQPHQTAKRQLTPAKNLNLALQRKVKLRHTKPQLKASGGGELRLRLLNSQKLSGKLAILKSHTSGHWHSKVLLNDIKENIERSSMDSTKEKILRTLRDDDEQMDTRSVNNNAQKPQVLTQVEKFMRRKNLAFETPAEEYARVKMANLTRNPTGIKWVRENYPMFLHFHEKTQNFLLILTAPTPTGVVVGVNTPALGNWGNSKCNTLLLQAAKIKREETPSPNNLVINEDDNASYDKEKSPSFDSSSTTPPNPNTPESPSDWDWRTRTNHLARMSTSAAMNLPAPVKASNNNEDKPAKDTTPTGRKVDAKCNLITRINAARETLSSAVTEEFHTPNSNSGLSSAEASYTECPICDLLFTNSDMLTRHMRTLHGEEQTKSPGKWYTEIQAIALINLRLDKIHKAIRQRFNKTRISDSPHKRLYRQSAYSSGTTPSSPVAAPLRPVDVSQVKNFAQFLRGNGMVNRIVTTLDRYTQGRFSHPAAASPSEYRPPSTLVESLGDSSLDKIRACVNGPPSTFIQRVSDLVKKETEDGNQTMLAAIISRTILHRIEEAESRLDAQARVQVVQDQLDHCITDLEHLHQAHKVARAEWDVVSKIKLARKASDIEELQRLNEALRNRVEELELENTSLRTDLKMTKVNFASMASKVAAANQKASKALKEVTNGSSTESSSGFATNSEEDATKRTTLDTVRSRMRKSGSFRVTRSHFKSNEEPFRRLGETIRCTLEANASSRNPEVVNTDTNWRDNTQPSDRRADLEVISDEEDGEIVFTGETPSKKRQRRF